MSTGEDRVLSAAATAFAESGYTAASIRQIAEHAGMSTGSLFKRYPTKRALLIAVIAEGTIRGEAHVRVRLHQVHDPLERLRTLVVAHLESLHDPSNPFMTVALREFYGLSVEEQQSIVHVRDAYERLWQGVVDDAVELGIVSDDPLLRLFLLSVVNHTAMWYRSDAGLSLEELGSRYVGIILKGAGAVTWDLPRSDLDAFRNRL